MLGFLCVGPDFQDLEPIIEPTVSEPNGIAELVILARRFSTAKGLVKRGSSAIGSLQNADGSG
jgi:hypothetical protein